MDKTLKYTVNNIQIPMIKNPPTAITGPNTLQILHTQTTDLLLS